MPSLADHVWLDPSALLPHQERVILSDADYTLIHGGVGAAKTRACLWHVWLRAIQHPNQVIVIAALTQKMLKDVIVGPWIDEFPSQLYRYVGGDDEKIYVKCLSGGKDSMILLRAMDADFKIQRLRGITITGYYFAQSEMIPESAFHEAQQRIRDRKNEHLWFRLFDANASSTAHWVYRYLIDTTSDSYVGHSGASVDAIHVRTVDNPSAYSPEQLEGQRLALGDAYYDRVYNGVWGSSEGAMFQISDGLHVRADLPTGEGRYALAIDYGYNFAALLLYIQTPYIHVVDEVVIQESRRDAQFAALRQMLSRHGNPPLIGLVGDPAGTYPLPDGRTISANRDLANELGLSVFTVNKARSEGWRQVIEFLGTEIGSRPRVTFSVQSVRTVRALREMVWSSTEHEDSDAKCFDHPCDALRYALMSRLMQHE